MFIYLSYIENIYLSRLNIYLEDGLIRVGGRFSRSFLDHDSKHPMVSQQNKDYQLHIAQLHNPIASDCSSQQNKGYRTDHSTHATGRQHVLSELRRRFWVLRANAEVRRVLGRCVKCRRHLRPSDIMWIVVQDFVNMLSR